MTQSNAQQKRAAGSGRRAAGARAWVVAWLVILLFAVTGHDLHAATMLPVSVPTASVQGPFQSPARVAVNRQSQLLVSDPIAHKVFVVDAFGRVIGMKSFDGQPLGIAAGADGTIFLGDASDGSVSEFDGQWNLVRRLGQGTGEFKLPGHIALLIRGGLVTVIVSDGLAHCLRAYRDGVLVGQYGSHGSGPQQLDFPTGVWVAPDRTIFVVDQNNDRIQVLDENGQFLRGINLDSSLFFSGFSGRAQGIVGDAAGRLFVADAFQGHIKVFDRGGAFLGLLAGFGHGPGRLRSPGGLALDDFGRLWVANANGGTLEEFGLDCFVQLAIDPAVQSVAAGGAVSFSVTAACGDALSYQWYKDASALTDGSGISGSTNANLMLSNVQPAATGSYSVRMSLPDGMQVSPGAQLTVVSSPVITVNPTSRTVTRGNPATFSVTASGGALSYQWLRNGAELAGATQSVLQITNTQAYEAGGYAARISNSAGTVTSLAATLTVLVPPTIEAAPVDQIVAVGSTLNLTVSAVGMLPMNYQWFRNDISLAGQTKTSLGLTNVNASINGTYLVRVSNSGGVATASFKLAVDSPMTLGHLRPGDGSLTFSWSNPFFVLQAAPETGGPWQLLSVTSPFTVTPASMATNPAQYFRLQRQ